MLNLVSLGFHAHNVFSAKGRAEAKPGRNQLSGGPRHVGTCTGLDRAARIAIQDCHRTSTKGPSLQLVVSGIAATVAGCREHRGSPCQVSHPTLAVPGPERGRRTKNTNDESDHVASRARSGDRELRFEHRLRSGTFRHCQWSQYRKCCNKKRWKSLNEDGA